MKVIKKFIALTGTFFFLMVILAGCGTIVSHSWVGSGISDTYKDDGWAIKANTLNGHVSGDVEFKSVDVTGEFNDSIDMGNFEPGKIKLRLDFENSEDVNIAINW